jgi:hypothetical protein
MVDKVRLPEKLGRMPGVGIQQELGDNLPSTEEVIAPQGVRLPAGNVEVEGGEILSGPIRHRFDTSNPEFYLNDPGGVLYHSAIGDVSGIGATEQQLAVSTGGLVLPYGDSARLWRVAFSCRRLLLVNADQFVKLYLTVDDLLGAHTEVDLDDYIDKTVRASQANDYVDGGFSGELSTDAVVDAIETVDTYSGGDCYFHLYAVRTAGTGTFDVVGPGSFIIEDAGVYPTGTYYEKPDLTE